MTHPRFCRDGACERRDLIATLILAQAAILTATDNDAYGEYDYILATIQSIISEHQRVPP